jgi:hypothetical protein
MKVEELALDQDKARELYERYQEHREGYTDADREIATIYKQIAAGRTVIRALESIRAAGCNEEGLPKLAICPAHMTECWYEPNGTGLQHGHVTFGKFRANYRSGKKQTVRMDWPFVPKPKRDGYRYCATVPLIPVHLRPKHALHNYHILFEAEWTRRYPVDPFLLRRFGGDAWLVLAAWDLTDVERAVMSSRINA